MSLEIARRYIAGKWKTVLADESGGSGIPQGGPLTEDLDGGGQAITQLDGVTIATSAEAVAGLTSPFIVAEPTVGTSYAGVNLNSDGAGNVDGGLGVAGRGTGTAYVAGSDDTEDGWFQWYTAYGWEHQPRSAAADATPTFVLHDKNGANLIEARAGATLGFYGATPVAPPVIPLTLPSIQNVIDALVALGLVVQHD